MTPKTFPAKAAFVIANPKSEQINLTQNNQVVAKTLVDEATRTAVLIMPASLVESGMTGEESRPSMLLKS